MRTLRLSFKRRFRSRYGMKSWPTALPALSIKLSECTDVISYLKLCAGIPEDTVIWDRMKIDELIKSVKNRMVWFHLTTFGLLLLVAFVILLSAARIISENSASYHLKISETVVNLVLAGLMTGIALLFLKRRSVGRDRRGLNFIEYLSEALSIDQKSELAKAIMKLKEDEVQLLEVGNYEKLYEVALVGWTAENWFLLLTSAEKDRSAIWLDSQHPLGNLMVSKKSVCENRIPLEEDLVKGSNDKEGRSPTLIAENENESELFWERIRGLNSRYILSRKSRLKTFIDSIDKFKISHFHSAWLEAMIVLLANYDAYIEYIKGNLNLEERKRFERILTPIFAKISDNYKKAFETTPVLEREKIDTYGYGIDNTRKFLTGRNENIEDWIGKNTPNFS